MYGKCQFSRNETACIALAKKIDRRTQDSSPFESVHHQAELWSGWMCVDPSAEDPLEPCPPPPPPLDVAACVAAACAMKFFPFSTFSMKFLPMARTDGFRLCRGEGLSTAATPSDTPVSEDMLALDDC